MGEAVFGKAYAAAGDGRFLASYLVGFFANG